MPFNATGPGVAQIPLTTFGGLVTSMSPTDLPPGVSPDCPDMSFIPGSVQSRPCLRKLFNTPFGSASVTYQKSYVDPAGVVRNLFLDSNGNLWVENVTASAGTYTKLTTTTPGSYAKSTTAFGREYIAISDGLHGAEIPLQYDGTNLDRVTQDGPGAPPAVENLALPSVAMVGPAAPAALVITSIYPDQSVGGYFTTLNIYVAAGAATATVGSNVIVAGTTYNGSYTVITNPGPTGAVTVSAYNPAGSAPYIGAGTLTIGSGIPATTMIRTSNVVTVYTAAAHRLQPGYRAQITGVTAATIGTVSTIVTSALNSPGLATVTLTAAHGLVPGVFVSITGVSGVAVGSGATAASRQGQVTTITTTSAHGLVPGASVTLGGFADASFNTTAVVAQVPAADVFTFIQADTDATDTTGTVTLNWPIPNTPTPQYFQVVSTPTTTSFQVQINYSDGTWTTGTVSYAWDGTFYVKSVPTTTSFTYSQYGPDDYSTVVGKVTPQGQIAPGLHQLQVLFKTRSGYITAPSPPVKFTANGGQYISVSNIPIGPSNVVARILAFTGAQGAFFYYIPVPADINGQLVSTSTELDDNTTTAAVLDFSDATLYQGLALSKPGNNAAAQITLDGALGFGLYGSRLLTYGQRNRIQNLLNLGFDGGYLPSTPTIPTGWALNATTTGGSLQNGHYGAGWQIVITPGGTFCGLITQSFYRDAYSAPIGTAATRYKVRLWVSTTSTAADVNLKIAISSAGTGFVTTATVNGASMSTSGGWVEATFSADTPAVIPSDMILSVYAVSGVTNATLLVDEISVIYSATPYLLGIYGSYVNNPEAFDGVTGYFGPQDTRQVMGEGIIRNVLYVLTEDPSGRLHSVTDNGVTEPVGWQFEEVGTNCGLLSTFGLTVSQADDATGSGGEEWMAWASEGGAMVFSGSEADWRITQEIDPDWKRINPAAYRRIWALNDYDNRIMYFGLPLDTATAPNRIYSMNYWSLDTAREIFEGDPVRVAGNGRESAVDRARKWSPWTIAAASAARIYRASGTLETVFGAGTGIAPAAGAGYGNAYTLGPAFSTDDDYGQLHPYYVTYFGPDAEQEQSFQVGAMRKTLTKFTGQIYGVGVATITPLIENMTNAWRLVGTRTLALNPTWDMEWAGASATGFRMAFKIASNPATGTDNGFGIQRIVPAYRQTAHMPERGVAA